MKNRKPLKFVPQGFNVRTMMEPVEPRILFSTANPSWWQSGDAALGTLKDPQGNIVGSATLGNGLLTVNGTSAGEEVVLGMAWGDPTKAYVRITRCTDPITLQYVSATFVYDRAALTGIVVNAGDGDDYLDFLSFGRALSLPVTLNGGAGDDGIEGNGKAWDENRPDHVVDTTDIGVAMHGGDGNDTLWSGLGPDLLDGGNGDDLIVVNAADQALKIFVPSSGVDILHAWALNHWVDSLRPPPAAPEPQPAAVEPATTAPVTMVDAPPIKAAAPAPFATNPLLTSDDKLWDA